MYTMQTPSTHPLRDASAFIHKHSEMWMRSGNEHLKQACGLLCHLYELVVEKDLRYAVELKAWTETNRLLTEESRTNMEAIMLLYNTATSGNEEGIVHLSRTIKALTAENEKLRTDSTRMEEQYHKQEREMEILKQCNSDLCAKNLELLRRIDAISQKA